MLRVQKAKARESLTTAASNRVRTGVITAKSLPILRTTAVMLLNTTQSRTKEVRENNSHKKASLMDVAKGDLAVTSLAITRVHMLTRHQNPLTHVRNLLPLNNGIRNNLGLTIHLILDLCFITKAAVLLTTMQLSLEIRHHLGQTILFFPDTTMNILRTL
jgi:hypothetical protein